VIRRGLTPDTTKPRIGAVNGPAVTGGLELALGCDFLIASERATFADTHARVGVMPAGGMTIRLPELVGINRARQMSLTGNFVDASTACAWGLVNEVVSHDRLLLRTLELAGAIAEADPAAIAELRSMYGTLAHRGDEESYREEARWSRRWMQERFDPAAFQARRKRIIERGSSQQ
jgi:enoyl-CoA hydratase